MRGRGWLRRRQRGTVVVLTVLVFGTMVVPMLLIISALSLTLRSAARATVAAQIAAYQAAGTAETSNEGITFVDPAATAEVAFQSVRDNMPDTTPVRGTSCTPPRRLGVCVAVETMTASIPKERDGSTSRAFDPDCTNPAYCWRDADFEEAHRFSGVQVTVRVRAELPLIGGVFEIPASGYAEFAYLEPPLATSVPQLTWISRPSAPPATTEEATPLLQWGYSGIDPATQTVECSLRVLAGGWRMTSVQPSAEGCADLTEDAANARFVGGVTLPPLAPGSYQFTLTVRNNPSDPTRPGLGVTSSSTEFRIVSPASLPGGIDVILTAPVTSRQEQVRQVTRPTDTGGTTQVWVGQTTQTYSWVATENGVAVEAPVASSCDLVNFHPGAGDGSPPDRCTLAADGRSIIVVAQDRFSDYPWPGLPEGVIRFADPDLPPVSFP
jgi:hypothetical protein